MDTATLPRHAYHHLMYTLRRNLPPAPADPAAAIARDYAVIAQVSSLCPANAAEAAIAAQAVAANAQAMATMGLANDPATERHRVLQCVAQAASMMRQAQGALRTLKAMQAERHRREADGVEANSSAWIEYGAAQWMAEALPVQPAPCPDAETAALPRNTDHTPVPRIHETESGERLEPSPDAEGLDQSQNPEHLLSAYGHETELAAPRDRPRDATVMESSQDTTHILMSHSHETDPAGRPIPQVVKEAVASSRKQKRVLMSRSHETHPVTPRMPPPTDRGTWPAIHDIGAHER